MENQYKNIFHYPFSIFRHSGRFSLKNRTTLPLMIAAIQASVKLSFKRLALRVREAGAAQVNLPGRGFFQQTAIPQRRTGGQIGNEKLFVQDLGFFRNRGRQLVDDDFKHCSIIEGAKPTKRTRKAISKIAKTPVPNLKKSFDFVYGFCIRGTAQSPTNPKF